MIGLDLLVLCEAEWMKYWDPWMLFLKIIYNHTLLDALGLSQVSFSLGYPQNAVEENCLQNLAEKGSCQRLEDQLQCLTENQVDYVQRLAENEMDYGHLKFFQVYFSQINKMGSFCLCFSQLPFKPAASSYILWTTVFSLLFFFSPLFGHR